MFFSKISLEMEWTMRIIRQPLQLFLMVVLTVTVILFSSLTYAETAGSQRQAWSGYWWPYVAGGLATGLDYRGHPAPLEKYELLTDGFLSGTLTYPYLQKYYDPAAPGWYGLCYAWASVSTFAAEPGLPSVHDNILFRVGDKKGLYTLAHTNDAYLLGDGEDPAEFHDWLTRLLGEQQQMFFADLDPGPEVWSYPIYAYDMTYGPQVGDQQSVQVIIFYASDFVTRDFVGTKELFQEYTYQLTYADDGGIASASWTGASQTNHPQRLALVQEQRSSIAGLDWSLLTQIGTAIDDELERPGTVLLPPGTYQMISLDQDRYLLSGREGDALSLEIEKLEGPENPLAIEVQDLQGTVLDQAILTDSGEHLKWQLTGSLDHSYVIDIQHAAGGGADFYQLDFNHHSLLNEVLLPYVPSNGWWNGFAITNLGDAGVSNVSLTSLDMSGSALQSHIEPQTLLPGDKLLTVFSTLPQRSHERQQRKTLAVLAAEKVAVVNLFGGATDGLGGFFSGQTYPAESIQLPFSASNWAELSGGGVINRSASEQTIVCSVYRSDGLLLGNEAVVLLANQKLRLNSIRVVAKLPADGWLDLTVQSQEDCLTGYQVWRSLSDITKLEAIRGLVAAPVQWLPHVENGGIWSTQLTVINPQSSELNLTFSLPGQVQQVTLAPYEKRKLSLESVFPGTGAELSQAAIKISGTAAFSAYVTYQTGEDFACVPLLQQKHLAQKIALPHLSVISDWWTGVVLFNPNDFAAAVTVTLTPVKADGQRWLEQQTSVSINAGEKIAFSVEQYWPAEVATQFSHSECVAANGELIGGLYLYGRNGAQQVTGSNLPVM